MKQEYIDYAKEISVIGDQTQVAANLFGELSKKKAKSIEELKAIVEDYKVAKNGFVKCKENLEKIAPPKVIIEEHTELVNTYNKLIESVEIHLTALNLNDGSVDFDLISKGFKLNATAIKEVGEVTDKIVTVFQNN
ncbi:hypothetical protein [Lysinibacillus xylanilyticus]|uniref:hypothetical protein n=1 Tax=Lysinibacillus xylanilyticus TaxID=582475 RepID=UPI003D024EF6